jgi:hypothetical protein
MTKQKNIKKIKSRKQLKAEKKRIRVRREELEKKIRVKWEELKESLKPANMARETLQNLIRGKTAQNLEEESILKSTLNYGISLLAKRFTDKAGEKFEWLFKKNGRG